MRNTILATSLLLLCTLVLTGCQDSERLVREAMDLMSAVPRDDEAALDAAYQEAKTRALLIKKKNLRISLTMELEQFYRQRKEPFERQRELDYAQRLAQLEEEKRKAREQEALDKRIKGLQSLRAGTRCSYFEDGSQVLILLNDESTSVDFHLECKKPRGFTKTLFLSVPAYGSKEVGFAEGWPNNFWPGDTCHFYLQKQKIRSVRIHERDCRS